MTDAVMTELLTFAGMSEERRKMWQNWGMSHDWGKRYGCQYDEASGTMQTATDVFDTNTRSWTVEKAKHATVHELRSWAGY